MDFFGKFKTYFVAQKNLNSQKERMGSEMSNQQNSVRKNSTDSFQLIMEDIISDGQALQSLKAQHQEEKRKSKLQNDLLSDKFQNLQMEEQEEEEPQQQIHNMYVTGIVFINKYAQGRQITISEWNEMINKQNLSLQSQKNIYFSFLKGIHFSVRKRVWELLANTSEMMKLTEEPYSQLVRQELVHDKSEISIIDKDVPRSVNITHHTKQLRNILIAYVNFSGRSYTQGMNLIAGSLLQMLSFQNDTELEEFGIMQESFQERVFWVFIGVMKYKNWEHLFQKDLSGLKEMLGKLQAIMVEYVPAIYQKIVDYDWDLTIFSQYYITILLYNTPKQFAKIILDLFLLDGENVIHSLVIRMLKLNEDYILTLQDEGELMNFFKKQMIQQTFEKLQKDKINAKKLQDFQINFIQSSNI